MLLKCIGDLDSEIIFQIWIIYTKATFPLRDESDP